MCGSVTASSRAIIASSRNASGKPTKLGLLNAWNKQGSSVNGQRRKVPNERRTQKLRPASSLLSSLAAERRPGSLS